MTARILTPTPTCCEPEPMLRLHVGQTAICPAGKEWIGVDAIDEGRGDHEWYTKWVIA